MTNKGLSPEEIKGLWTGTFDEQTPAQENAAVQEVRVPKAPEQSEVEITKAEIDTLLAKAPEPDIYDRTLDELIAKRERVDQVIAEAKITEVMRVAAHYVEVLEGRLSAAPEATVPPEKMLPVLIKLIENNVTDLGLGREDIASLDIRAIEKAVREEENRVDEAQDTLLVISRDQALRERFADDERLRQIGDKYLGRTGNLAFEASGLLEVKENAPAIGIEAQDKVDQTIEEAVKELVSSGLIRALKLSMPELNWPQESVDRTSLGVTQYVLNYPQSSLEPPEGPIQVADPAYAGLETKMRRHFAAHYSDAFTKAKTRLYRLAVSADDEAVKGSYLEEGRIVGSLALNTIAYSPIVNVLIPSLIEAYKNALSAKQAAPEPPEASLRSSAASEHTPG